MYLKYQCALYAFLVLLLGPTSIKPANEQYPRQAAEVSMQPSARHGNVTSNATSSGHEIEESEETRFKQLFNLLLEPRATYLEGSWQVFMCLFCTATICPECRNSMRRVGTPRVRNNCPGCRQDDTLVGFANRLDFYTAVGRKKTLPDYLRERRVAIEEERNLDIAFECLICGDWHTIEAGDQLAIEEEYAQGTGGRKRIHEACHISVGVQTDPWNEVGVQTDHWNEEEQRESESSAGESQRIEPPHENHSPAHSPGHEEVVHNEVEPQDPNPLQSHIDDLVRFSKDHLSTRQLATTLRQITVDFGNETTTQSVQTAIDQLNGNQEAQERLRLRQPKKPGEYGVEITKLAVNPALTDELEDVLQDMIVHLGTKDAKKIVESASIGVFAFFLDIGLEELRKLRYRIPLTSMEYVDRLADSAGHPGGAEGVEWTVRNMVICLGIPETKKAMRKAAERTCGIPHCWHRLHALMPKEPDEYVDDLTRLADDPSAMTALKLAVRNICARLGIRNAFEIVQKAIEKSEENQFAQERLRHIMPHSPSTYLEGFIRLAHNKLSEKALKATIENAVSHLGFHSAFALADMAIEMISGNPEAQKRLKNITETVELYLHEPTKLARSCYGEIEPIQQKIEKMTLLFGEDVVWDMFQLLEDIPIPLRGIIPKYNELYMKELGSLGIIESGKYGNSDSELLTVIKSMISYRGIRQTRKIMQEAMMNQNIDIPPCLRHSAQQRLNFMMPKEPEAYIKEMIDLVKFVNPIFHTGYSPSGEWNVLCMANSIGIPAAREIIQEAIAKLHGNPAAQLILHQWISKASEENEKDKAT